MLNPVGSVDIPVTVFGGLNTELSPTDLPLGLSPDCSNVAFLAGSVFTSPPLRRLSTLGTTAQVVYTHSFVKRDGTVVKMDFDSLGGIWANGVKVGSTKAGNRFFCANAFGRTFIAISDGTLGADVPLQFDGVNLDRVSQDGPGAGPSLSNLTLPPLTIVAGTAGTPVPITTAQPIAPQDVQVSGGSDDYSGGYNPPQYQTYYTALQVTTSTAHGLTAGEIVSITGNTAYNYSSVVVQYVISPTVFTVYFFDPSSTPGTGGTVAVQAPLLSRNSNQVSAVTSAPNNLRVGYSMQISGIPPQAVGSISSLVIDNEDSPGLATITTPTAHGLQPGNVVTITGVNPVTVGGSVTSAVTYNGVETITTASAHNLSVGAQLILQIGTHPSKQAIVTAIISATQFTELNNGPNGSDTTGSVQLEFPTSTIADGNQYTVQTIPSATSFTIPVSYVDGTWTSGSISFPWNGTFYVSGIQSSTAFTYTQSGPDAILQSGTGTVTPLGQVAPGQRPCVVIFQTRTGYTTVPSPRVKFTAGGGQYISATNIAIGPPNVIARILAFPSANGGRFFYLPVAPRDPSSNSIIGTSTVINDNTTTSAILDFTDDALLAGIAIDIPGNNLFQQIVLGSCLAFFSYQGRLNAWGERNKIQQFHNMGFEGGVYASAPNVPLGWNITGTGALVSGDYGLGWLPTGGATLSQGAYLDENGIAILTGDTQYTFRAWTANTVTATISSASTGFTATATVNAAGANGQAVFSAKTPLNIPPDMQISYAGTGVMDELEIIYTANPAILAARASYINNLEAFDDVTGNFGPSDDPNPITGMVSLDGVLSLLTNGPKGSHYRIESSDSGEPATWTIRRHGEKCGLISPWGIATFETWFTWASDTGLRIFAGGEVEKMSQEIQSLWDSINPLAKQFTILGNDPYERRLHILTATGSATVTNSWWVMDYRELNTSAALANAGTLRVVSTGKVITTDLTRKWCPWSRPLNYCTVLQQQNGSAVMAFCGGTGVSLNDPLYSAVYTLAEGDLTGIDDDYGPFWQNSYYTTAFIPEVEAASQFQLKPFRMLFTFLTENVSGNGKVVNTTKLGGLETVGRVLRGVPISPALARDRLFGLNDKTERLALKIGCAPAVDGGAAGFYLSSIVLSCVQDAYSEVSGYNK